MLSAKGFGFAITTVDAAAREHLSDPRSAVVPVDQELLCVVRPPERLAVEAQVQLPVVAFAHDRRRDRSEAVVEIALALLGPEDHVGVGGLGRGEVGLRQGLDDLDAARRRA